MRRYNKALFLLIPVISAAIFLTGHTAFASGEQSISESTSIECTGGSCYKVSCINDQCQTFSYNQPSSEQLTGEEQPAEEAPTMRLSDETSDMQPIDDATEQYIEVPVEFCYDGLDNDDDGKVDEECGATTFSSASPNDLIGEEDHKQQSSIDGLEQPSEEYEHNADESEEYESNNEASEEEEHGHDFLG